MGFPQENSASKLWEALVKSPYHLIKYRKLNHIDMGLERKEAFRKSLEKLKENKEKE